MLLRCVSSMPSVGLSHLFARVQIVDNSPTPAPMLFPPFEPQSCAPGTPGLSLSLSFGTYHNSRALVVRLTPHIAAYDARFFVITLAGIGLSFSSNRDSTFISPIGVTSSAHLNISSVAMIVSIASSRNFPQNEPIIFAFGDLESVGRHPEHLN
jgi:hypothetical protein